MLYTRSALARKSRTPNEQIGKHHRGAFVPPEHSGRLRETVLDTYAFARAYIHEIPCMCIFVGDLPKKVVESQREPDIYGCEVLKSSLPAALKEEGVPWIRGFSKSLYRF